MIFDTNVLIYADREDKRARDIILAESKRAISAVTYMEFVPHCKNKRELATFDRMLEELRFTIYDIDRAISEMARGYVHQYALSHSMEMGDALLAATAAHYAETLCTSNVKHFRQIRGINLHPYAPD